MRSQASGWSEGRDGATPIYVERLLPPWWAWPLAAGFAGSLAVAYGYALGPPAGVVVAVITLLVAFVALLATSPLLRVDDRVLRAGRARLPRRHVGRVAALDVPTSRAARTVDLDPAAFLLLRTWCASRLVVVEVTDERDPHPYWLVSSRHPERLVRALRDATSGDRDGGLALRSGA